MSGRQRIQDPALRKRLDAYQKLVEKSVRLDVEIEDLDDERRRLVAQRKSIQSKISTLWDELVREHGSKDQETTEPDADQKS